MESLWGFQYLLNLLHSCKICRLDSMGYWPHGQLSSLLGKNLSLYSPIGAWLVIALVALVQSKFEWPKFWSHRPPLIYNGSSSLLSPSTRLRKWLPFRSDAWKIISHLLVRSLHSSFLLKSQESLLGYKGVGLKDLVSESTALWRCHLERLGHSQNSMQLSGWCRKKEQSSFRMETTCFW